MLLVAILLNTNTNQFLNYLIIPLNGHKIDDMKQTLPDIHVNSFSKANEFNFISKIRFFKKYHH